MKIIARTLPETITKNMRIFYNDQDVSGVCISFDKQKQTVDIAVTTQINDYIIVDKKYPLVITLRGDIRVEYNGNGING